MTKLSEIVGKGAAMEVFACSSSNSDRIQQTCKEAKMKLIAKPVTKDSLQKALKSYM